MTDDKRGPPEEKLDGLEPALGLLYDNFRQGDELSLGNSVYLRRDSTNFYQVIVEGQLVDVIFPDRFGSALKLNKHLRDIRRRFGVNGDVPDEGEVGIGRGFQ